MSKRSIEQRLKGEALFARRLDRALRQLGGPLNDGRVSRAASLPSLMARTLGFIRVKQSASDARQPSRWFCADRVKLCSLNARHAQAERLTRRQQAQAPSRGRTRSAGRNLSEPGTFMGTAIPISTSTVLTPVSSPCSFPSAW